MLLVSTESSWNITGDKFRPKYSFNLNHTKVRTDVITRDDELYECVYDAIVRD